MLLSAFLLLKVRSSFSLRDYCRKLFVNDVRQQLRNTFTQCGNNIHTVPQLRNAIILIFSIILSSRQQITYFDWCDICVTFSQLSHLLPLSLYVTVYYEVQSVCVYLSRCRCFKTCLSTFCANYAHMSSAMYSVLAKSLFTVMNLSMKSISYTAVFAR